MAIAGVPTFQKYDDENIIYILHFTPNTSLKEPTEIFIPPQKYKGGYAIKLSPNHTSYSFSETILYIFNKGLKPESMVKVTVTRKK